MKRLLALLVCAVAGGSTAAAQENDYFRNARFPGNLREDGQTIEADAPIEHIPVYVRGDSPDLLELFGDLPEEPSSVLR